MARIYSEQVYLSLKAAFRRLTKAAGGQQAAASLTRVDFQRIGRYGSPNEAMHVPIDVVADLERDVGLPMVTHELADLAGYILIPKPPAGADAYWVACLGELGKEAGEAIAKLAEALNNDGRIDGDEVRRLGLRQEVREAMEVLAKIDQALIKVEAGG